MAQYTFVLTCILCIFLGDRVNGVQVQFYGFFTGLVYESNSTTDCINVPANKRDVPIRSIKTDTCVTVYYNLNCRSHSRKFNPENSLGWNYWIRSFHICNENAGGPKLDVDITDFYDLWKPDEVPKTLENYQGICSCVNIPDYVQKMGRWSINNHGNELLAYYDKNCSEKKWKARYIQAGLWDDSAGIYNFKIADWATSTQHKIQSFGPDPNSTYYKISCKNTTTNKSQDYGKFQAVEKEEKYENKSNQGYELEGKSVRPQKRMDSNHTVEDLNMWQTNLERMKQSNNGEISNLVANQDALLQKNQDVAKKLQILEVSVEILQESISDAFIKLKKDINSIGNEIEIN